MKIQHTVFTEPLELLKTNCQSVPARLVTKPNGIIFGIRRDKLKGLGGRICSKFKPGRGNDSGTKLL